MAVGLLPVERGCKEAKERESERDNTLVRGAAISYRKSDGEAGVSDSELKLARVKAATIPSAKPIQMVCFCDCFCHPSLSFIRWHT